MIDLIDGNVAAAWAVRLARVDCVPCFPITPQTELIETLAKWLVDGVFKTQYVQMESEHSVISAVVGSAMTGARTFTGTSSQGLLLMHEILPILSGTRQPAVMVNVSRGLSAPITLWSDHNDLLTTRDAGWIIFVSETNQELLDTIIMGFKIGENEKIQLPVLVNMDGFIHSYTRTQVDIPNQKKVDKFLPQRKPITYLDVKKPMTLGTPVSEEYILFRQQVHKVMLDSVKIIKTIHNEWYKQFGRRYDLVEKYNTKDAEVVIVIMGASSTIAKQACDELRKEGKKVGVLRIRLYRPFPEKEIRRALLNKKHIVVMDQNISPGTSGILYPEIKSVMYGCEMPISNYIFSLGGKPINYKEIKEIYLKAFKEDFEVRRWVQ